MSWLINKIALRLGISIVPIPSVQNSKHVYLHMGGSSVAKLGQRKELQASLELVRNNSLLAPYSTTLITELRFMMIKTLAKIMD